MSTKRGKAVVTLTLTPQEFEAVKAALAMLAYVNGHGQYTPDNRLHGFTHDLSWCAGDPHQAVVVVNALLGQMR